jgi:aspartyl-tRNA(Asn)/glutamyl-tRNA(Gln) amidotransferase subunit A
VSELVSATAAEIAAAVGRRVAAAVEVFDAFAARVEALNPRLNAVIRFDPRVGRAEAAAVDRRIAGGDTLPLAGVPFTVKDNLWVKGRVAAQGSALFADFVAPEDAPAVARLRAAGAVFLGTTNCSEFACKGNTTNRLFGPTRNPWDLTRTPGGSSGGAASAVAAGLGAIALGTDGGGSIRRPAAHVGVVGMKPSAGLVPHTGGFVEPVFGNSVIGQMARTVEDIRLMLDAITAPDLADPQSPPVPVWSRAAAGRVEGLRVAFSPRLGLGFPVDPDVAANVRATAERLASAGATVEETDPQWPEGASEQALMPLQLAGLASLYGERFKARAWDVDPDIGAQIEAGLRLSGVDVAHALHAREALYRALARFFERFDLLLAPTTPVTAWPIELLGPKEIEGKAVTPRGHAVFTPLFNHTYMPACSVPCGLDRQGLPVGIQVVGPRFADARVLGLAEAIERTVASNFRVPRTPASDEPIATAGGTRNERV